MKFLPSMPALVKGILITVITLVLLKFVPSNIKAMVGLNG